ncbi:MAG: O-antigen ligase family protein [Candidatus Eisenbacteria bacterium]|nr:O-antigen ligase family protein [Candidatus Eisenbacteria bacterium]
MERADAYSGRGDAYSGRGDMLTASAARSSSRLLDLATRAAVVGMAISVVALGHVTSTLPLFYALMGASLTVYLLARGPEILRSFVDYLTSRLVLWRWAFLIWAILSLLWTARGPFGVSRAVTLVQMHVVGLFFYDAARRLGLTRLIAAAVFISAAAATLHAIVTEDPATAAGRLTGLYASPNTLAIVGVVALAVFFSGLLSLRRVWQVAGAYVGSMILLIGVLASASLKGLAGTLSVAFLGSVFPGARRRVWTLMAAVVGFMTLLFSAVEPLRLYWNQVVRRVEITLTTIGVSVGTNESLVERARFIRKGADLIAESPLFGRGLESFRWLSGEMKYAHNNYIEIGVSLGIVGLVLYYAFPLAVLVSAIRSPGRDPCVRRFILIVVPTLLILDMAFVSYATKLVSLLMVMLAGWIDHGADVLSGSGAGDSAP